MIKHAFIVPLIGGQAIGQAAAFGSKPDYLLSYSPFSNNDSHLVNHWSDVPYVLLDQGGKHPHYVDVVGATCPCAGLSALSGHASPDAAVNNWLYDSTKYVLEEMKPRVLWGENAPGLATNIGKPVVAKLRSIAVPAGYTMSLYRTKTRLHGGPQVRERSFYFFWRGDTVPLMNYFDKTGPSIEDVLDSVNPHASQQVTTHVGTPSQKDPFYRYVLEGMEGGITHREFYDRIAKTDNPQDWIERSGKKYDEVAAWMRVNGLDKAAEKCDRMFAKLATGGNIMRRGSMVPKDYIGAFVGHYPTMMTHHREDRYITYREAMTIMGLPQDFELLHPAKFLNHVCQNVPVATATDLAMEIKAVLNGQRDSLRGDMIHQYNASRKYEVDDVSSSSLQEFI